MKESIFNKYISMPDGETLVFNSLSCGLAIIDSTYKEIISLLPNININNLTEEQINTYNSAIKGNFLLPDGFDELLDFKTKRNIKKYDTSYLNLTIAPTLLCNFKCIYCYEENKSGTLSKKTEDNIIKFIDNRANLLNTLNIDWYGGEPILAFKNILSMSDKVIQICNKYNIKYSSTMITNGSLITNDIVIKMKNNYINEIQVTLDGPPEIHENRRIAKDNNIKFFTILDNINRLLENDINVIIRINIDKNNENYLDKLFEILDDKLINKSAIVSFGQVIATANCCNSISDQCFSNSEFAKNLLNYYSILHKYNFISEKLIPYPHSRYNYCSSEIFNSYVIDPDGNLYKCWNVIGNKEQSIGNINDIDLDLSGYKHGEFISKYDITKKCEECNILPLCLGGCPIINKKNNKINCDLIKYNLDDILLKHYQQSQEDSK